MKRLTLALIITFIILLGCGIQTASSQEDLINGVKIHNYGNGVYTFSPSTGADNSEEIVNMAFSRFIGNHPELRLVSSSYIPPTYRTYGNKIHAVFEPRESALKAKP